MFALRSFPRQCAVVLSLAILSWSGCSKPSGPRRVAVRGTVLLAGQPPPPASISFQPESGHSGPAANCGIDDGRYQFTTADGPTAGPYRVVILLSPAKALGAAAEALRTRQTRWEFSVNVPETGFTKDFQLEDR
jgi:hypothetical protein